MSDAHFRELYRRVEELEKGFFGLGKRTVGKGTIGEQVGMLPCYHFMVDEFIALKRKLKKAKKRIKDLEYQYEVCIYLTPEEIAERQDLVNKRRTAALLNWKATKEKTTNTGGS